MGDQLKKVRSGDPLTIPAQTFNTFIDAARDFRERQSNNSSQAQNSLRHSGIVLVKNNSGADRDRFNVLGIDAPIFTPTDNLDSFKNKVALQGVVPTTSHQGKFAILLEPLKSGAIGMAMVSGVCPVKITIDNEAYRFADVNSSTAESLKSVASGSAFILWKETGTGLKWAIVRLGNHQPTRIFPVNLTQVGGTQGDEATPATWTYDVTDVITGETLETAVDPTAAPHKWQRPGIGWMIPATFGYAHYEPDGSGGWDLVLGWINEMVDQEACETAGGSA